MYLTQGDSVRGGGQDQQLVEEVLRTGDQFGPEYAYGHFPLKYIFQSRITEGNVYATI